MIPVGVHTLFWEIALCLRVRPPGDIFRVRQAFLKECLEIGALCLSASYETSHRTDRLSGGGGGGGVSKRQGAVIKNEHSFPAVSVSFAVCMVLYRSALWDHFTSD